MTIGELGSIGEFVGGLLVVVSLIYLAAQVRQNTRAMRVSAFQTAVRSSNEWSAFFVKEPDLGPLLTRGLADHRALSAPERVQFDELLMSFLRDYSSTVLLEKEGFVRRGDISSAYEAALRRFFASPNMMRWWERHKQYIAESARAEVSHAIAASQPPTGAERAPVERGAPIASPPPSSYS